MWEPIVWLCAFDSVLAFWQTFRNFKFMTTILSHLGWKEAAGFARIKQPCSSQFVSDKCIRRRT